MKLEGEFRSPDGGLLRFAVGAPEPSGLAAFECHVRLEDVTQNHMLVDHPVFGEDPFQALHLATSLIHTLSGWEEAMTQAQQPPTPP